MERSSTGAALVAPDIVPRRDRRDNATLEHFDVIVIGPGQGGDVIMLDVGKRFRELNLDVPNSVMLHNARTIMEIDEVPEHLVVIGGGPVGA